MVTRRQPFVAMFRTRGSGSSQQDDECRQSEEVGRARAAGDPTSISESRFEGGPTRAIGMPRIV